MHVYVYIPLYPSVYECLSSTFPTPIVPCPWGPADLIYVVEGGALIRPVAITLLDTVLHQGGQHDDDSAATLPHHLGTETQASSILSSLDLEKPSPQEPTCQKSAIVWDSGPCVAM